MHLNNNNMQAILNLIDSYINKNTNYNTFYSEFNKLYFDSGELENFSEEESDFLNEINEKLFFVGDDPIDEQSRKDGYIGAQEFRDWLTDYKQKNSSFWNLQ